MKKVAFVKVSLRRLLTSADWGIACGDKFLVIGRGVRRARASGVSRPASIVIYANPKTSLPEALADSRLDSHLRNSGHRVTSVTTLGALQAALQAGGVDIVMSAVSDMNGIEPDIRSASSKPALLPVIYNPTGKELAAAERQYHCVMKAPSRKQDYVDVINEALKIRADDAKKH